MFEDWCKRMSCPMVEARMDILLSFGAYCFYHRGNKAVSVKQKMFAIHSFWVEHGYSGPSLTKTNVFKKFVRGMLHLQGGVTTDPRQPVTAAGLERLFRTLSETLWEDIRARAFLAVAYCGACRKSEWTHFRWQDITWSHDGAASYVRIYLPTEKGLLYRESRHLNIVDLPRVPAVTYLLAWWSHLARGRSWQQWLAVHGTDFVFSRYTGSPMNYTDINKYLNQYAVVNNVDPATIKAHSLRIGFTTDLARNNAADRVIQTCGRWNSDCFRRYVRLDEQAVRDARRNYAG